MTIMSSILNKLNSDNFEHRSLVALLARGADPAKTSERLEMSEPFSLEDLEKIKEALNKSGYRFLNTFFGQEEEHTKKAIDNLANLHQDLITETAVADLPITTVPKQSGLVLVQMESKDLDEIVEPTSVANRLLNRIKVTVEQPLTPEELLYVSRALKEVSASGLCGKKEISDLEDMVDGY